MFSGSWPPQNIKRLIKKGNNGRLFQNLGHLSEFTLCLKLRDVSSCGRYDFYKISFLVFDYLRKNQRYHVIIMVDIFIALMIYNNLVISLTFNYQNSNLITAKVLMLQFIVDRHRHKRANNNEILFIHFST